MKSLRKFARLSSSDQRLLIASGALLAAIRIGLWLIPFSTLRRLLGRMQSTHRDTRKTEAEVLKKIVWAVSVAGRCLPKAGNCLAQALATQVMLGRRGHDTTLRIGVARSDDGQCLAHAWLEAENGRVVIGGSEAISRFVPLPPLREDIR
jgi:hypothetical protein